VNLNSKLDGFYAKILQTAEGSERRGRERILEVPNT
jgi:hypothetical protein